MSIEYFDRTHSKPLPVNIEAKDDGYYLLLNNERFKIIHTRVIDKSDQYWRIEIETSDKGTLVVTDHDSIQYLCQIGFIKKSLLLKLSMRNRVIGLSGVLLLVVYILYVYGLTFFVDRAVSFIPKEMETSLIEEAIKQFDSSEDIVYVDSVDYVLHKSEKILENLDDISYDLTIKLVNSPVKNAFSLPGGRIYIFRGLLNDIKTEDELFALLLHEAAHIEKRHGMKRLVRSAIIGTILGVLVQDVSGISAIIIENSSLLLELSYNRDEEIECDRFAYTEGNKLGIRSDALADLFANAFVDSNQIELPAFISTHPNTEDRIKHIRSLPKKEKTNQLLTEQEFNALFK